MSGPEHTSPSQTANGGIAKQEENAQDLGFGVALANQGSTRLVNPDGSFNVLARRRGLSEVFSYDTVLEVSWPRFFMAVLLIFAAVTLLFACLYLLCGTSSLIVTGPDPRLNTFERAYFFSVHTFSTIGYGNLVAAGTWANAGVVLEAFTSLLSVSLIAGCVFARFARPNVRFEFSRISVVRLAQKPALLIRLRNTTRSEVLELEATLMAWFVDVNSGTRHFHHLPVERNKIAFLPLSWTVAHFINEDSPFFGITWQEFRERRGEVLLQIRAIDQKSAQTVYARASYDADDIGWNMRFAEHYIKDGANEILGIDPERFHLALPEQEEKLSE